MILASVHSLPVGWRSNTCRGVFVTWGLCEASFRAVLNVLSILERRWRYTAAAAAINPIALEIGDPAVRSFAFDWRLLTTDYFVATTAAAHPNARRQPYGSLPPKLRQFSAALPHFRRHKMSIRRTHGSFPPAISAGKYANYAKSAICAAFYESKRLATRKPLLSRMSLCSLCLCEASFKACPVLDFPMFEREMIFIGVKSKIGLFPKANISL
jgi:hypothetical protein